MTSHGRGRGGELLKLFAGKSPMEREDGLGSFGDTGLPEGRPVDI